MFSSICCLSCRQSAGKFLIFVGIELVKSELFGNKELKIQESKGDTEDNKSLPDARDVSGVSDTNQHS